MMSNDTHTLDLEEQNEKTELLRDGKSRNSYTKIDFEQNQFPKRKAPQTQAFQAKRPEPVKVMSVKEEEEEEANNSTLIIAFIAMLVFQLGNRIFGRLMTYPMHNYPSFVNLLSVGMYVPMCFLYILPMMRYGAAITKEQLDIPKIKFAVMGGYDSLAGIMQSFAVNYISNAGTIVLVQQSAIPISMAISVYTLGAAYTKSQYLGATVVMVGIIVVLIPQLMPAGVVHTDLALPVDVAHGGSYSHSYSHSHSHNQAATPAALSVPVSMNTSSTSELVWIMIMVVSCVPMVLSSVYKEKALGEMEIDVVFLNGWVAVFQFLFSIPLTIPSSWAISMSTAEIMPNMYGGLRCYFGVNSVTEYSGSSLPLDNCTMSPVYVNLYLFFNVIYNVLIVVILKHGSSNILWLSSTIIVPLSNLAFSMDFMPGHKPLTMYDIVGLVVIMGGLIVYRFSAPFISLANRLLGISDNLDEEKESTKTRTRAERKQTKYMGLNQIEGLSALFDTRMAKERRARLFRSPQQIRGSLLLKLGIPPSPHISLERQGRGNSFIEISKHSARSNSFIEMKSGVMQKHVAPLPSIAPRSRSHSITKTVEEGDEVGTSP